MTSSIFLGTIMTTVGLDTLDTLYTFVDRGSIFFQLNRMRKCQSSPGGEQVTTENHSLFGSNGVAFNTLKSRKSKFANGTLSTLIATGRLCAGRFQILSF